MGIRKAATPRACSVRSLASAPDNPIQLCAGRLAGGAAAVLNDGSRGEYETRARTRRSAKTSTRKPISSLSRRLAVGTNARDRTVMLALGLPAVPRRFFGLIPPARSSAGRHHRHTRDGL